MSSDWILLAEASRIWLALTKERTGFQYAVKEATIEAFPRHKIFNGWKQAGHGRRLNACAWSCIF